MLLWQTVLALVGLLVFRATILTNGALPSVAVMSDEALENANFQNIGSAAWTVIHASFLTLVLVTKNAAKHVRVNWRVYLLLLPLVIGITVWTYAQSPLMQAADAVWRSTIGTKTGENFRFAIYQIINVLRIAYTFAIPIVNLWRQIIGLVSQSVIQAVRECPDFSLDTSIIAVKDFGVSTGTALSDFVVDTSTGLQNVNYTDPHFVPYFDFVTPGNNIADFVATFRSVVPCACKRLEFLSDRIWNAFDVRELWQALSDFLNAVIALFWEAVRFFLFFFVENWCDDAPILGNGTNLEHLCDRHLPPSFEYIGQWLGDSVAHIFGWLEDTIEALIGWPLLVPWGALGEFLGGAVILVGNLLDMLAHAYQFGSPLYYFGNYDFSPLLVKFDIAVSDLGATFRDFGRFLDELDEPFPPIDNTLTGAYIALEYVINGTECALRVPIIAADSLLFLVQGLGRGLRGGEFFALRQSPAFRLKIDNITTHRECITDNYLNAVNQGFPNLEDVFVEITHIARRIEEAVNDIVESGNLETWFLGASASEYLGFIQDLNTEFDALAVSLGNLLRRWTRGLITLTNTKTQFPTATESFTTSSTTSVTVPVPVICDFAPPDPHDGVWNETRIDDFIAETQRRCKWGNLLETSARLLFLPLKGVLLFSAVAVSTDDDWNLVLCQNFNGTLINGPLDPMHWYTYFDAIVRILFSLINGPFIGTPCETEILAFEETFVEDIVSLPFKLLKWVGSLFKATNPKQCSEVSGVTVTDYDCSHTVGNVYNILIAPWPTLFFRIVTIGECLFTLDTAFGDFVSTVNDVFGVGGTFPVKLCAAITELLDLISELTDLILDFPGWFAQKIEAVVNFVVDLVTCVWDEVVGIFQSIWICFEALTNFSSFSEYFNNVAASCNIFAQFDITGCTTKAVDALNLASGTTYTIPGLEPPDVDAEFVRVCRSDDFMCLTEHIPDVEWVDWAGCTNSSAFIQKVQYVTYDLPGFYAGDNPPVFSCTSFSTVASCCAFKGTCGWIGGSCGPGGSGSCPSYVDNLGIAMIRQATCTDGEVITPRTPLLSLWNNSYNGVAWNSGQPGYQQQEIDCGLGSYLWGFEQWTVTDLFDGIYSAPPAVFEDDDRTIVKMQTYCTTGTFSSAAGSVVGFGTAGFPLEGGIETTVGCDVPKFGVRAISLLSQKTGLSSPDYTGMISFALGCSTISGAKRVPVIPKRVISETEFSAFIEEGCGYIVDIVNKTTNANFSVFYKIHLKTCLASATAAYIANHLLDSPGHFSPRFFLDPFKVFNMTAEVVGAFSDALNGTQDTNNTSPLYGYIYNTTRNLWTITWHKFFSYPRLRVAHARRAYAGLSSEISGAINGVYSFISNTTKLVMGKRLERTKFEPKFRTKALMSPFSPPVQKGLISDSFSVYYDNATNEACVILNATVFTGDITHIFDFCVGCDALVVYVENMVIAISRMIDYYVAIAKPENILVTFPEGSDYWDALKNRTFFFNDSEKSPPELPAEFEDIITITQDDIGMFGTVFEEFVDLVSKILVNDRKEIAEATPRTFARSDDSSFVKISKRTFDATLRAFGSCPIRCANGSGWEWTCLNQTFKQWGGLPRLTQWISRFVLSTNSEHPMTLGFWFLKILGPCDHLDDLSNAHGRAGVGFWYGLVYTYIGYWLGLGILFLIFRSAILSLAGYILLTFPFVFWVVAYMSAPRCLLPAGFGLAPLPLFQQEMLNEVYVGLKFFNTSAIAWEDVLPAIAVRSFEIQGVPLSVNLTNGTVVTVNSTEILTLLNGTNVTGSNRTIPGNVTVSRCWRLGFGPTGATEFITIGTRIWPHFAWRIREDDLWPLNYIRFVREVTRRTEGGTKPSAIDRLADHTRAQHDAGLDEDTCDLDGGDFQPVPSEYEECSFLMLPQLIIPVVVVVVLYAVALQLFYRYVIAVLAAIAVATRAVIMSLSVIMTIALGMRLQPGLYYSKSEIG